jgi:hypothetical protein
MKMLAPLIAAVALLGCQKQDAAQKRLDDLTRRVEALERRPAASPPRPAAPDPATVYSVPLSDAFARGDRPAKVTLVECSDYA